MDLFKKKSPLEEGDYYLTPEVINVSLNNITLNAVTVVKVAAGIAPTAMIRKQIHLEIPEVL